MTDGPLLFTRFAYPPNELGYCGPDASGELLERVGAGASGPELRTLAGAFAGAWPYLQLIAAAGRLGDPLDPRVVEAYWIGNSLLERVSPALLAASLTRRFPQPTLRDRDRLLAPLAVGARPHHGFHVFAVYPWLGLLRGGLVEQPLHVLDRCRVRWGRIRSVDGDTVTVRMRPLAWNGHRLSLGPHQLEQARISRGGHSLSGRLRPGDWCALHWDWVCLPLTPGQLQALQHYTATQLAAVNATAFPAPAAVLA
ncbi:MAG TPA: DUF6390 family protein [Mycobacteriales bacterium]|nr:DUF6390 family protein [Mycobacteriales bacterium]